MLKPIWFLIKLVLFIVAVMWIAERPGHVEIEWQGYLIETSFGVIMAIVLVLVAVTALLYRVWRSVVTMPKVMRRYNHMKNMERGYATLTRGLVAVASGDAKAADKLAGRARRQIPDNALTHLLMAQSAQMNGKDQLAKLEYEHLLEDKDAAFFGLKGLMNQALKQGDDAKALELLKTAETLHPKRLWIVESLFYAEARMQDWQSARQTLSKAIRLGVFDRDMGRLHDQALLVMRAYDVLNNSMHAQAISLAKRAYRVGQGFAPANLLYARLLTKQGRRRKAISIIEQSWPVCPHPDLVLMWQQLAPPPKGKTEDDRKASQLDWYKRLYNVAPYRPESNEMLGRAAMDLGLYTEAREWLKLGMDYVSLAKLERLDGRYEIKSREWLERATKANPKPEWTCDNCGNITPRWHANCDACHSFNTIEWRPPRRGRAHKAVGNMSRTRAAQMIGVDEGVIDVPK